MSVDSWTNTSSQHGAETAHVERDTQRVGRLRPVLGVADLFLQLWRAKLLMFLVFLVFVLAGLAITLLFPTKYTASTRLLVTLGQEHVFDPVTSEAARGAYLQNAEVLQAEMELARSPVIAERVIDEVGLARVFPKLAERAGGNDGDGGYARKQKAVEAFAKSLSVSTRPNSSIVRIGFAHEDGELAATIVNAFVDAYVGYRKEVLSGGPETGVSAQRNAVEARLQTANLALRDYLTNNDVSDFEAERSAASEAFASLSRTIVEVESNLSEAEGRARGLARQLQSTPRELDLYVESASGRDLEALKLEREQLLSRYRAESQVVRDIDNRIQQLQNFIESGPAEGLKRVGPNPTYQAIEADLATERASIMALSQKGAELVRQKEDAEQSRRRLALLEPDYRRLLRDRDALDAAAGAFAEREQTDLAMSELEARKAGNIAVYEPARPPTEGASPKRAIAAGAGFLGLLTALVFGLLRAWSQKTFASATSLERTLGLKVLTSVKER